MNRLHRRALTLLTGAFVGLGLTTAPAAAITPAPYCGQVWGSLPENTGMDTSADVVTDVRAGRHACFDRLVVDLHGPGGADVAYDVRYVETLSAVGTGDAIPLRGGAALRVIVRAAAYDDGYGPTYLPPTRDEVVDTAGYDTFAQVVWAGSFEGQTTLGIGTRAHLPFRAFTLDGAPGDPTGTRVVVDVAHRW